MTSPHIVIIDDDREFRQTLEEILQSEGFETTVFRDDHCLDKLKEVQPDIILVDYWLTPNKNSEELIEKVAHEPSLKKTPVILMSNDRSAPLKANKNVVKLFLEKPFEIDVLLSSLQMLSK